MHLCFSVMFLGSNTPNLCLIQYIVSPYKGYIYPVKISLKMPLQQIIFHAWILYVHYYIIISSSWSDNFTTYQILTSSGVPSRHAGMSSVEISNTGLSP